MRHHARHAGPSLGVAALLLSGCFPFEAFFPMPPIGGESVLTVENATDENWVLRVVADNIPAEFAIAAGKTGTVDLYGGTPTSVILLDEECEQLDDLEWTDSSEAVRIGGGGELSEAEARPGDDEERFVEYWECMSGFGPDPTAGDSADGAPGTIFAIGGDGTGWRIEPASAVLQPLSDTDTGPPDAEHELSPDGTRVAFARYREDGPSSDLYVADADGDGERLVIADAGSPTWSPDGTLVAYVSLDPFAGSPAINVIDLSGGEPLQVAEDASTPRWSPDGRRIAYYSSALGGPDPSSMPPTELRVVNVDGSGAETLADASPYADRPAWSPDGNRIAFSSGTEEHGAISVVDIVSGEVEAVAEVDGASLGEPAWSPDGRRIAFSIMSFSLFSAEGAVGVVALDGDGGIERIDALADAYVTTPTWSHDGGWLAAVRTRDDDLSSELVLVDMASGDATVVATGVVAISSWRE